MSIFLLSSIFSFRPQQHPGDELTKFTLKYEKHPISPRCIWLRLAPRMFWDILFEQGHLHVLSDWPRPYNSPLPSLSGTNIQIRSTAAPCQFSPLILVQAASDSAGAKMQLLLAENMEVVGKIADTWSHKSQIDKYEERFPWGKWAIFPFPNFHWGKWGIGLEPKTQEMDHCSVQASITAFKCSSKHWTVVEGLGDPLLNYSLSKKHSPVATTPSLEMSLSIN